MSLAATPLDDKAAALVARLRAGEALALSKAITALENDLPEAGALIGALRPHLGHGLSIGVTGPPGVGKSTLVNGLIGQFRAQARSVGVVAVDPSSPLSGGAILGDRVRMTDHGSDPEVFIRSLASRGHLGGLAPTAARVVDALDAAGKEVVLIETVGAGQSEIEIAAVADIKIVVLAPGLGDEMQALKAGILEIADILVVNKADRPLAEQTASQLKAMLSLRAPARRDVPVLLTAATDGQGLEALVAEIDRLGVPPDRAARRRARTRQLLAGVAADLLRERLLADDDPAVEALCDQVERGTLALDQAARRTLEGS
ncbi:MAG: methylmalonyl Co-A mutase-associated GTPase MeaB [Pseudomonadota bacterium]